MNHLENEVQDKLISSQICSVIRSLNFQTNGSIIQEIIQ